MRRTTPILAALLLTLTTGLTADEQAKSTETKKDAATTETRKDDPDESPLVKAARKGKANREGEKSRISITNADVEKAGGKIIQSSDKPLVPLPANSDVEKTMRDLAAAKSNQKNKNQLTELVAKYQKEVTDLERELRRIEETYYNEDDPDYREDVLALNFDDTKKQLEAARKELAKARKALGGTGDH